MKEKHCPGPWKLVDLKGAGLQIHATPTQTKFGVYKFVEGKIVKIYTLRKDPATIGVADESWIQFPTEEWDEMQRANGYLIAAAPEMYEALKAAKESLIQAEQLKRSGSFSQCIRYIDYVLGIANGE
jgi:hypothetical protein